MYLDVVHRIGADVGNETGALRLAAEKVGGPGVGADVVVGAIAGDARGAEARPSTLEVPQGPEAEWALQGVAAADLNKDRVVKPRLNRNPVCDVLAVLCTPPPPSPWVSS